MFPPNPLIKQILLSCLAKAQSQHRVTVCHFVVESTHVHMIVVVEDPDDVKEFMRVFKCESAHAVNRLLGRKKRTVWCEGYDSPPLLNPNKAVEKIIYTYSNPSKDNLERDIEAFPGLSSWEHYRSGKRAFRASLIPRDAYYPVPEGELELSYYKREARRLTYKREKASFVIEPDAWLNAMGVTEPREREQYNKEIVEGLREAEKLSEATRVEAKKGVVGAKRLALTPIGTPYTPDRKGIKTICLGTKEERREFVTFVRELIREAREVLAEWRRGNYTRPYPLGLYPPSMAKRGNLLGFC